MDSKLIRQKFLDFFKSKQHTIVPSAPLVVHNDPTLMFTNAGMNQFKDIFLGNTTPNASRVADTQKCLRVSGKHNDLEEVGIDTYHHTMFEMLGNWSFGDYFKEEAIRWAWELLVDVYGLPKERLYATVFGGDENDGLDPDNESFGFWESYLPKDRILYCGKKDNFWEMGEVGPCGPCSEIHIDLRSESEIEKLPGRDLVNKDHPLVIEIWNLVFIQFQRLTSGNLESLPARHVDTGMGLERLVMAIQSKTSNYDTDLFAPLINKVEQLSGKKYHTNDEIDIAIRVIIDHIRAIAFAIADGQLPSNVRAGYVIRRILRRAVRYGYTFLGLKEPFLYQLIPVLSEEFDGVFPELKAQEAFITKVVKEEETAFLRTLENGLKRLEQITVAVKKNGSTIDGKTAFELYDTYGFPLDLTALIARENGLEVDEAGFDSEMTIQKSRSKQAGQVATGDWVVLDDTDETSFVGYESLKSTARLLKYREVKEKSKSYFQLVFDQTPFYAESGGQVGDTGFIASNAEKVSILDTKKENELIVHITNKLPSRLDTTFELVVDGRKRKLTMANHSATHLMHAALREVLGDHVQQKGSLVNDKLLRFDFSHFTKMTTEEIQQVEKIVNSKIREGVLLDEKRNVPIDEAKEMGAMALFGEKYGDFVRVITFDPNFSVELCGGTHVPNTGRIGFFKIISESSIAAGVRRIEAITSESAEQYVMEQEQLVHRIREMLKNPKDPVLAIHQLMDEKVRLNKEIENIQIKQLSVTKDQLKQKVQNIGSLNVIVSKEQLPSSDALKKLSFELKNEVDNLVLILAADIQSKPQIAVVISEALVEKEQLNAAKLVKELASEIKGGGGGQPFFATAGGKDLSGLDRVVEKAYEIIEQIS